MNNALYQRYYNYLSEEVVTPFYNIRLNSLSKLRLEDVLKRKNPYLFKAKNIELAGDLVRSIIDAFLSSQEETIFGNLLEGFAIYVSQSLDNGFKSKFKSVDLEFERDSVYYIVGIKSGTNWGNSDQIAAMRNNFKIAKQSLRQEGFTGEVIAVNGCMYGRETTYLKNHTDSDKIYYKYAGQAFWNFISNDDNLYQEIIVPIDKKAKERDEIFKSAYAAKVNKMTQCFMLNFMKNNLIDWVKLIDYVSKREKFIQMNIF
ncbi:PmeII family type II restriction endonuclease [Cylindrospermum sp. FACHB-282]|uniref:PmeII family type II restriction endonuclease n=1 Tax=Cylindrospermum sp. FACHB-282 TaxID=2692794 RepID=UPI001684DE7F|nr:PmeII family type II restriction endonuclease [Cylindrospermum sp. FACHB-282]MBD2384662.1 cytosolic protein [Cylindrospermum sp. FACHB-282]